MLEKAEQIIIGAKIINKALGIQNAVIAIDENKPQAIEKLTKISKSYNWRQCPGLQEQIPSGRRTPAD